MDELKQDLVCNPTGNEPNLNAYFDFEAGQAFGDNVGLANFSNLASSYGMASVRNLAMGGTVSNIVSGDLPSFLYQDLDGDGFGGAIVGCNFTGQTVTNSTDCDDQNSLVNPDAIEICNGIDDDCSGIADDIPNVVASTNIPVPIPEGQTITSTLLINSPTISLLDLNVLNLNISHIWIGDLTVNLKSPQGTEITLLDAICGDQDDLLINFDDESIAGYGTFPCPPTNNGTYRPLSPLSAFDGENPNGTWTLTVIDVYEDAGVLKDWSIEFPSIPLTLYADLDGDGFGNPSSSIQSCNTPIGYVANSEDCDDQNASIYPGAMEVCNDLDDNCDGQIDENTGAIWYADADGDGYGNALVAIQTCLQPSGYVANSIDCDDNNITIYPNATEIVNGLDDDCDGMVDDSINVSTIEQIIGHKYPKGIEFTLLPNPADEMLHVVFAGGEWAVGRIEIFNPIGQRIQVQEIRVSPGSEAILRIDQFPQGNYFLIFRREDGVIVGERFVVLRGF